MEVDGDVMGTVNSVPYLIAGLTALINNGSLV